MAKHIALGQQGEQIATDYLTQKGYQIVCRNWTHQKAEIDIIARSPDGNTTVFVEVKTRRSHRLGYPEQAVTRQKQRLLSLAAEAYIDTHALQGAIRFDIIAITLYDQQDTEIYHIEDAFFGFW